MSRIDLFGRGRFIAAAVLLFLSTSCNLSGDRPYSAVSRLHPQSDGVVIDFSTGHLKLQACSDSIIHVQFGPGPFKPDESLIVLPQHPFPSQLELQGSNQLTLLTAKVAATVDLDTAKVTFSDRSHHLVLAEQDRDLTPALVQNSQTFHVRQRWQPHANESLYGLGENQLGLLDLKGYDLDLWQHNGTAYVPMLVSSRGYGILWDNPSFTRFGDLRLATAIPPECLDAFSPSPGTPGEGRGEGDSERKATTDSSNSFLATYYADSNFTHLLAARNEPRIDLDQRKQVNNIPLPPISTPISNLPFSQGAIRWEATLTAPRTGNYQFQAFFNGQLQLWIDGKLLMNHWRQDWLPWYELSKVHFTAGSRHELKVEWSRQGGNVVQLLWKPPTTEPQSPAGPPTSLASQVAGSIDYYFIDGQRKIDNVIAGYRQLTGEAPMMPQWAFGLWQSRQRYETAQQSLDVIAGFRSRQIPFDNIVQDWFYWPADAWGSHQFDPKRFPDPNAWIKSIHDQHAHVMISVWGKFYTGTKNFDAMNAADFLYPENLAEHMKDWLGYVYTFFDAFNPAARDLFWAQVKPALFDRGIDAWWLDASEPDILPTPTLDGQITHMNPTALGPGSKVLNAYAIMEGKTFYPNQRAAAPDQRVFILTRSGFASQQRYAEATWSGDSSSTWTAMRKQIQAGLSFSISGIPYWTMDDGGFSVPARFSSRHPNPADVEEWRELNTRWFEFGAFVPIQRVHGEYPYREMWQFGGEDSPAYRAQFKFDRLRYQLLPYIYSLAGDVTQHDGTIMRPLVMDFPTDSTARECTDEYLFGPSILVSPITTYKARARSVYLPAGADWYDFWTNEKFKGGQTIDAPAPYDTIPLHIRAGSILPFGPDQQYVAEKPANPITLRIYTGTDATFTLYEDDGFTYAYERGQYAEIPIDWNDKSHTLTIAARRGGYTGMLQNRTFNVVYISPIQPASVLRVVEYHGVELKVK